MDKIFKKIICVTAFLLISCSSKEETSNVIDGCSNNVIIVRKVQKSLLKKNIDIEIIQKNLLSHEVELNMLEQKITSVSGDDKDATLYLLNLILSKVKNVEELRELGCLAGRGGNPFLKFMISTNIYATIPEGVDKQVVLSDIIFSSDSLVRLEQTVEWCKIAKDNYAEVKWLNQIALSKIAMAYFELGDYQKAKDNYINLYDLKKYPYTCLNIAKCCIKQKKIEEALEIINEGIKNTDNEKHKTRLFRYRDEVMKMTQNPIKN